MEAEREVGCESGGQQRLAREGGGGAQQVRL